MSKLSEKMRENTAKIIASSKIRRQLVNPRMRSSVNYSKLRRGNNALYTSYKSAPVRWQVNRLIAELCIYRRPVEKGSNTKITMSFAVQVCIYISWMVVELYRKS